MFGIVFGVYIGFPCKVSLIKHKSKNEQIFKIERGRQFLVFFAQIDDEDVVWMANE